MFPYLTFAAVQLDEEKIRPISEMGIWVMGIILVVGVLYIAITEIIVPAVKSSWQKREEKAEADGNIEFDLKKSTLNRGHRSLQVPENSLEYFVCKLVFKDAEKPQLDINVLEAAKKDVFSDRRAVEQAVRRINKKAKAVLELKNDLLLRRKEKTLLNDIEQLI